MWRVVEFDKGPVAAVLLLITFVLGLAKLLLG
jgi:hypothetical protein